MSRESSDTGGSCTCALSTLVVPGGTGACPRQGTQTSRKFHPRTNDLSQSRRIQHRMVVVGVMGRLDVVQYCSSVRAVSPMVCQREHLADVQDVAALLVAVVHLRTDLRQPAALRTTQTHDPFTALLLLGDRVNDPSFHRAPRHRWNLFAFMARRRQADGKLPEERYTIVLVSLHIPVPAGATRTEGLLRCGVTAHIVVRAVVPTLFFTLRTDTDDACARPMPEVRMSLKGARGHALLRRNPEVWQLIWRRTTHRVYALPMVALCWSIASCGNGACP